ncbi:oxidoreductase [Bhargavaea cecembensis]|uniref:Oxidoreductase n=1 Tax=Bhargavaea cecembensis TaxID=394098 RepID=A0A165GGX2_9BACL|nr:Gfo/Idh/MocA family oxidoreductase [Bhargavaea cecembensis]KZE36344.1 oxidoreductase [Bhargavaea cecembensis]
MDELNVCVIGTGMISDFHLQSYKRNNRAKLYGVYDLSLDRASEKAARYGVQKVFRSLDEVFADPEVDAVSICTWNHTHAELGVKALEHGKHVLMEKPLAMSYPDALQIADAASDPDIVFQVGFVRRFAAGTRVLKTFIEDGLLGKIYYAKGTQLRRIGNPGGWFADRSRSGGGPLIDLGVHLLDVCWYLMGKPEVARIKGVTFNELGNRGNVEALSFYKAADYSADRNDVEDLAAAMITFKNGATLMLDVSFSLHAKKDETGIRLFGKKGGAELEPELVLMTEQNNTILNIHPQIDHLSIDFDEAFGAEIDHFVSCCLDGGKTEAPLVDGIEVMKMLDGIYESSKTGKEVVYDQAEQ